MTAPMDANRNQIMRKITAFTKNALIAIGFISSLVTISWALFPMELGDYVKDKQRICVAFLIAFSALYGFYSIRKKKRIHIKVTERVKADIYFGNIFTNNGIVVIPVNEYFDTLVDDNVISINTLHGKFIRNVFGGDEKNLCQQISNSLSKTKPIEINENRTSGNKHKYALGTVCEVTKDGKYFYLVALTKFNEVHRAEVKNSEYQRVICDLLYHIEQRSQGRKVSIPLIGAGHGGVDLSKQKLLEFILLSIFMSDKLTLINGIDVVLHSSVESEIDLAMVEVLFKTFKG
jgi:hypothetical protein